MWPYTVNFVTKNYAPFSELNEKEVLPSDLTPIFEKCLKLEDLWMAQTFIYLKSAGFNVTLKPKLVPGEICFVESSSLHIHDRSYNSYVVACRPDRARSFLADQSTAMNKLAVTKPSEHHVYSWPQPVITKRDTSRGTRVETVDFKGNQCNLWEPFQSPDFSAKLKELGVNIKISSEKELSGVDLYRSWGDYSSSDILLAVRNLTEYDFSIKPELKLSNTWRAGVPAILGPEPAYQALRKSELDYIEVHSVDEALQAIKRLKDEPELYSAMVQNGLKRAEEFSVDKLTQQWVKLIEGPIFQGYEKWSERGSLYKHTIRLADFCIRAFKERAEIKSHLNKVRNGPRPLT